MRLITSPPMPPLLEERRSTVMRISTLIHQNVYTSAHHFCHYSYRRFLCLPGIQAFSPADHRKKLVVHYLLEHSCHCFCFHPGCCNDKMEFVVPPVKDLSVCHHCHHLHI